MTEELGDSARGIEGSGRRASGRVREPRPLTTVDPDAVYVYAEYDLADAG